MNSIFLVFRAIYGEKWTKNVDDKILPLALNEWAEGLAGLTNEDIKHVISVIRTKFEWPPSIAEFRSIAKARAGSYRDAREVLKGIEAPREYVPPSPLLQEYMAKHGLDKKRSVSISAQEFLNGIRQKLNMKERERDLNVPDF